MSPAPLANLTCGERRLLAMPAFDIPDLYVASSDTESSSPPTSRTSRPSSYYECDSMDEVCARIRAYNRTLRGDTVSIPGPGVGDLNESYVFSTILSNWRECDTHTVLFHISLSKVSTRSMTSRILSDNACAKIDVRTRFARAAKGESERERSHVADMVVNSFNDLDDSTVINQGTAEIRLPQLVSSSYHREMNANTIIEWWIRRQMGRTRLEGFCRSVLLCSTRLYASGVTPSLVSFAKHTLTSSRSAHFLTTRGRERKRRRTSPSPPPASALLLGGLSS